MATTNNLPPGAMNNAVMVAFTERVRANIEQQLREQVMPVVNLQIQKAADEAMEHIRPAIETYLHQQNDRVVVDIALRILDERAPSKEPRR